LLRCSDITALVWGVSGHMAAAPNIKIAWILVLAVKLQI
jgi:hypothetical protein